MRTDFPKEKALVGQPCSRYGPTSGSTWEVQIGFYGLQKKLEGGVGKYEILKKISKTVFDMQGELTVVTIRIGNHLSLLNATSSLGVEVCLCS